MYKNYNTAQTCIALNLDFNIPNNHTRIVKPSATTMEIPTNEL